MSEFETMLRAEMDQKTAALKSVANMAIAPAVLYKNLRRNGVPRKLACAMVLAWFEFSLMISTHMVHSNDESDD